jgi:hypothetical protein
LDAPETGAFDDSAASEAVLTNGSGKGGDPLAGRNGCGMANNGHNVTMPTRFSPQNAEPILGMW